MCVDPSLPSVRTRPASVHPYGWGQLPQLPEVELCSTVAMQARSCTSTRAATTAYRQMLNLRQISTPLVVARTYLLHKVPLCSCKRVLFAFSPWDGWVVSPTTPLTRFYRHGRRHHWYICLSLPVFLALCCHQPVSQGVFIFSVPVFICFTAQRLLPTMSSGSPVSCRKDRSSSLFVLGIVFPIHHHRPSLALHTALFHAPIRHPFFILRHYLLNVGSGLLRHSLL